MIYKTIEKRIKQAIDTRERGELSKSRRLFESLLKDLEKQLHKDSTKKLKYIYATAMGEYVIQYRLESRQLNHEALDLGRKLLEYDRRHKLDNPLSLRSVSNTLLNIGGYEEAEDYVKRIIKLYRNNSGRQGDSEAHLAYVCLRTNRTKEAEELIGRAINNIKKNTGDELYISIWLSHALMVKSLIYNTKGKLIEAIETAKEALKVAKTDNRVFRIKQAQELIDFLKKKLKKT